MSVHLSSKGGDERMYVYARERGQGMVEYALLFALITLVVIVVLILLGPIIGNVFSNVGSRLQTY
jgi:pilus assembly protein Flp/PilA